MGAFKAKKKDAYYCQKTTNKTWVKGLALPSAFFWSCFFNCKMWAGPGPLRHLLTPAANQQQGLSESDLLPDELQRGSLAHSFQLARNESISLNKKKAILNFFSSRLVSSEFEFPYSGL